MSDNANGEKSIRIGFLCTTLIILGFMLFLAKINACTLACNSCNTPSDCKDEFYELHDGVHDYICTVGAQAEVVTSPPAPKPGILCRCTNKDAGVPGLVDAGHD
jgi:hypothetical protein